MPVIALRAGCFKRKDAAEWKAARVCNNVRRSWAFDKVAVNIPFALSASRRLIVRPSLRVVAFTRLLRVNEAGRRAHYCRLSFCAWRYCSVFEAGEAVMEGKEKKKGACRQKDF